MGIIKQMPEHTDPAFLLPKYLRPSRYLRLPLRKLNKSHIIDLCYKFKQENLFHVTNACDFNAIGRCNDCLGCAERSWGFLKNNKQDPGRI
jgi:7-cyano-7-deazaguanine synthase in queuosine biosynthesis